MRLPGRRLTMGLFHFSNNNLAVRKRCAQDVGMYDPAFTTSEDVDLCFRVALSRDWVACREPGVLVRHKARRDLRGLLRQMWGWGRNVGPAYQRVRRKGLFFYWVGTGSRSIEHAIEWPRFPMLVCAMPTVFHAMHAAALVTVGFALASSVPGVLVAGGLTAWLGRRWADDALRSKAGLPLVVVHYLANAAFQLAAFTGGLRHGMVLVPTSILPPRGPVQRG